MFSCALSEFLKKLWPNNNAKFPEQVSLLDVDIPVEAQSKFLTNTFPEEIWLIIIDYMMPSQICDLLGLNSTFFHASMEYKYRQMCFAYLDTRMVRKFARLMDPTVAERVKILTIYPGCIMEALGDTYFNDAVPTIQNDATKPPTDPKHSLMRLFKVNSADSLARSMINLLSGLPNLTTCNISWHCTPSGFSRSDRTGAAAGTLLGTDFLMALGSRSTLRKLSLDLSMEKVRLLVQPDVFANLKLEELSVSLHHSSWSDAFDAFLAPAINSLRPTLRILSLQTESSFVQEEPSMFFALKTLPALVELNIFIPLEPPHLGDPMAFRSFLMHQRGGLKTLRLTAKRTTGCEVDVIPEVMEESFLNWMKSVLGTPFKTSDRDSIPPLRLPVLQHLEITSLFPKGAAMHCLRHFHLFGTPGLTSISLTGTYRSYMEVLDVVDVLVEKYSSDSSETQYLDRPQLQSLRLGQVNLSPQLIDLLSHHLPYLRKLDLIVKYVQPDLEEWSESYSLNPKHRRLLSSSMMVKQFNAFIEVLTINRSYPAWSLEYLSIRSSLLPSRAANEPLLQAAFLHAVPHLRAVR